jgi:hypothetical protein
MADFEQLQTIARFIEAATKTPNKNNPKPVKLSMTVNDSWFQEQWMKRYPAKVPARPKPANGYNPPVPKDASINDIVFEALGSKTNAKDLVLCEKAINSVKMYLWSNKNPMDPTNAKNIATAASDGAIPSTWHLSAMRTVRVPPFDTTKSADG